MDGETLINFNNEVVENKISYIHTIPGKIEAEHYFNQKGIELESILIKDQLVHDSVLGTLIKSVT